MKKHRILAIVMAVLMMAALITVPAMAADDGYITINTPTDPSNPNAWTLEGRRFDAYRIFTVTIVGGGEFAYVLDPAFTAFQTSFGKGDLVTYISGLAANSDEMNELAAALWEYIDSVPVASKGFVVGEEDDTTVVIEDLPYGYYLVYGSATHVGDAPPVIAACALTTTEPGATVNLKLDAPKITKKVWDKDVEGAVEPVADDPGWRDWITLDMNNVAIFKVSFDVPDMTGYDKYWLTVHDKMGHGFWFWPDVVITRNGVSLVKDYDFVMEYEIVNDEAPYDYTAPYYASTKIEITFDPTLVLDWEGDTIDIIYYGILNTDGRIIGGNTSVGEPIYNPNKAWLEYSSNPYMTGEGDLEDTSDKGDTSTTPPAEVKVYTFAFRVFKHTGEFPKNHKPLGGAKFELYRVKNDPTSAVVFESTSSVGYYLVTFDEDEGEKIGTVIESAASGYIDIQSLKAGTYWLTEIEAPDGYNELEDPVKIEIVFIDATEEYLYIFDGNPEYSSNMVYVRNNAGQMFPSTGGIGRVIFIVVGIALMGGAIVAYVARKRMVNLMANR